MSKLNFFQKLPPLPDYMVQSSIFVFTEDGTYHLIMFLILIPFVCIEVFIFVRALIKTTTQLLASNKMSDKTYELQKKFFIALAIQCGVPILTLIMPFAYSWVSILWRYYNQGLMNIAVLMTTMHGLSSTLVMLIVHRPYRQALVSMFVSKEGTPKGYGFRRNTLMIAVNLAFFRF
ncbi:hypothetical protein CAEBREN_30177 [Caenorhabditis brenneri]|uniref:Serpentine Receptor, class H n=1 Tax=Caenorhabditis brenneri TaxID=135651 RepID=G0MU69_CAEBE|nr:hypothetical protein CAEBREN_30177 [Caenorhabditis brenneri]